MDSSFNRSTRDCLVLFDEGETEIQQRHVAMHLGYLAGGKDGVEIKNKNQESSYPHPYPYVEFKAGDDVLSQSALLDMISMGLAAAKREVEEIAKRKAEEAAKLEEEKATEQEQFKQAS